MPQKRVGLEEKEDQTMLKMRVSVSAKSEIQKNADACGLTVSEFLRRKGLQTPCLPLGVREIQGQLLKTGGLIRKVYLEHNDLGEQTAKLLGDLSLALKAIQIFFEKEAKK